MDGKRMEARLRRSLSIPSSGVRGHQGPATAEWTAYTGGLLSIETQMRACLARLTRNPADTDELLQETYARLLSVDDATVQSIRSVRGFAMVVARRVGLDWLKHRRILQVTCVNNVDELALDGDSTEDLVTRYQEIEQFIEEVERLPPKCRQVFKLRRLFGFTPKEV